MLVLVCSCVMMQYSVMMIGVAAVVVVVVVDTGNDPINMRSFFFGMQPRFFSISPS